MLIYTEWIIACKDAGIFSVGKWIVCNFLIGLARCILKKASMPVKIDFSQLCRVKSNRIHVLIASHDSVVTSGAFRSCAAMAKLLKEVHGFDVTIVLAQHGDGERELQGAGVPYVVIPSFRWLVDVNKGGRKSYRELATYFMHNHKAVRDWRRLIKFTKPDIVHVNSMSCYVGGVAAFSMGIPVVWHMRDLLEEDHGLKIYNREEGLNLIGNSSRMIAVSDCVKNKYAPIFGLNKVVRVYNGVDVKRFYDPRKSILDKGVITFVFLGGFQLTKGHVEFAKACVELYRRGHASFRVWYVGDGCAAVKKLCENEFSDAGLMNKVTFWGRQAHPEEYLKQADIAFVCSRCEAFGRVTVEMMLSGCLVIGSNTGGTAEIITDGITGILFDRSNTVPSLADAMESAIVAPEKSRIIAAAGREFAFANMSSEKNAAGVASVYNEVLELSKEDL